MMREIFLWGGFVAVNTLIVIGLGVNIYRPLCNRFMRLTAALAGKENGNG